VRNLVAKLRILTLIKSEQFNLKDSYKISVRLCLLKFTAGLTDNEMKISCPRVADELQLHWMRAWVCWLQDSTRQSCLNGVIYVNCLRANEVLLYVLFH
jgi:hypothetical protein